MNVDWWWGGVWGEFDWSVSTGQSGDSSPDVHRPGRRDLKAIVDRWKLRNQTLHHTEADTPEVRQRLITQIKALYECHDRVLPTDRVIFQTPLTELLQSSTRTMQLFMQQNKTLVKHSIKLYQAQQQRQHRDIASYFIRNIRITRVTQGRWGLGVETA